MPPTCFPIHHDKASASSPSKLAEMGDIEELHRLACQRGEPTYVDPATGYDVFTADTLRARGRCCGCGCRHCIDAFPLNGLAAKKKNRSGSRRRPPQAEMLNKNIEDLSDVVDVLFWSGGKDSFLALRQLVRHSADRESVLLLTTYDAHSRTVAHQNVPVDTIVRQAIAMRMPLLGVPLDGSIREDENGATTSTASRDGGTSRSPTQGDYLSYIQRALLHVRNSGTSIRRLVFGDLHLDHIRQWRDSSLSMEGIKLFYPLWKVPYSNLGEDLLRSGVTARVCAVDATVSKDAAALIRIGEVYGEELRARLPSTIDAFGENGEFHTVVEVWDVTDLSILLPWGESISNAPADNHKCTKETTEYTVGELSATQPTKTSSAGAVSNDSA